MQPPRIEHFAPRYEAMPKRDLAELSFRLFQREVSRAYARNPFYHRKFTDVGVKPSHLRSRKDLSKLPVTRKEELLQDVTDYPPFGKRLQVPHSQIAMVVETGGTTGQGREIHPLSQRDVDKVYTVEASGLFWAGVRKGSIVMQTLPVTVTSAPIWWHGAVHFKLGGCMFHIGNYDAEEKLGIMRRYRPDFLMAFASYLGRLEFVAEQMEMDLKKDLGLKGIITLGEGASKEWVRRREERWGAKVYEKYGCTQRGFAFTCEYGALRDGERGVVHHFPHLCFIEVVDPASGDQVEPGQEGEVVVTPLGSEASPIIRFATGDRAKYVDSSWCPCGRPFDGFESCSIGRYDDMIKVKGVNIWQNAIDSAIFSHDEVLEYEGSVFIGQDAKETAAVYLEFRPRLTEQKKGEIVTSIAEKLRANTGLRLDVEEWKGPSLFEEHRHSTQRKRRRWTDRRFQGQSRKGGW